MKEGWEVKRLLEVTTKIGSGATPKGGKNAYKDVGLSLIRSLNIHDLEFRMKDLAKIDDAQAQALSNVVVEPQDVLLNITGASIARCSQVPEDVLPARVNQHVSILRPIPELVDSRFLTYLLVSKEVKDQLLGIGDKAGATRQALTKSQLQSFEIPLPPLEEQQRIVAVLDEAFEGLARARTHAEANLQNARELFESYREEYLNPIHREGWSMRPLSDLIHIKHGFAFKSANFLNEGQYAVLTPGNFFETGGFKDRGVKQRYYGGEFSAEFILSKGDLLVAMTEQAPGLLGSCMVVPEDARFLHNQRLGLITPQEGIGWSAEYFSQAFSLKAFRRGLSDTCSGATVRHTSPKRIFAESIPHCEDVTQLELAAEHLSLQEAECTSLQAAYAAKIGAIDELRQSLLQKAFAGELK